MKIDIVSVFPEYFEVMNLSLMGKAQAKGLLEIKAHNLRGWTHDVHHSVDDTPVGGGAGMVMKPKCGANVWMSCWGFRSSLTRPQLQVLQLTLTPIRTNPTIRSPLPTRNRHPSTFPFLLTALLPKVTCPPS